MHWHALARLLARAPPRVESLRLTVRVFTSHFAAVLSLHMSWLDPRPLPPPACPLPDPIATTSSARLVSPHLSPQPCLLRPCAGRRRDQAAGPEEVKGR